MSKLLKLTATELRRGLLQSEFSSRELTEACLEQCKLRNEDLNSFITISEKEALAKADLADQRLATEKEETPSLCGIPIAVKDIIITKGIETTCASKILSGFIPPYNSTVANSLEQAGAVIVGKTNMDEFGMGSSNEYSAFGATRNPWDLSRVPGGSSGGSAVAVSSGQVPISLGTDTGGSIRQPAAFTGIHGLKPTYGRVSRYGVVAYASSLDQVGPFARSIPDLALLLQAISGKDPRDSTSMDIEVPDYCRTLEEQRGKSLKDLRIGVPKEYLSAELSSDVSKSFSEALETLSSNGAKIVDISLPNTEYALATYYVVVPAEASSNLARYDGVRYGKRAEAETLSDLYEKTRAEGFGEEVKRRIMMGSYVLSAGYYDAYYRKAQQVRTLIIQDFKEVFTNDCDVIASPVAPSTAFKLGEKLSSPLSMYLSDILTVPANLAGLPSMSTPSGLGSDELPIGLQLIGPPFSEDRLLSVARDFSDNIDFDINAKIQ